MKIDLPIAIVVGFCVFVGAGIAVLVDLPLALSGLPAVLLVLGLRRLAESRIASRAGAEGASCKAVGARLGLRGRPPWYPPTLDPLPTIDEEPPEPASPGGAEHTPATEDQPADEVESDDEGLACVYGPVMDEAGSISTWDAPES